MRAAKTDRRHIPKRLTRHRPIELLSQRRHAIENPLPSRFALPQPQLSGHIRRRDDARARNPVVESKHPNPSAIEDVMNRRIIDSMARKLGLSPEKVVVTIDRHANTSAASVPLALAEAAADGRICRGQLVLLEAMGGGLTWGASLVRW